jgi:hypothetical protein
MKPKFILCLALVLTGGLFGGFAANAGINVPIIAAPIMRVCQEAKAQDLGLWDDVFRFENLDAVILRRGDELFSYSLVTSESKRISTVSDMAGSRIIDGISRGKHQWLFYQSDATRSFAIDLSTGKKVQFEISDAKLPDKHGTAIHAIVIAGSEGGSMVEICGDGVAGWPRDGNRPIYFWMSLESGKMVRLPTGWDLNYFSADQKRAVFENVSTNAMMYRPWVTLDMATGEMVSELPDQTKESWSEPTMNFWEASVSKYKNRQNVWQLRTPRTLARLLHPQPGRGDIDDKFAGLSVNSVDYPLAMTNIGTARCVDAKSAGNLAVFWLQSDGGEGNSLWVTQLKKNDAPILLATNCSFEVLGGQHCALLVHNLFPASVPEALVYDAESNAAWNILDGVPLRLEIEAQAGGGADRLGTVGERVASGAGPMVAFRLIPGFGSARYPVEALCLCSTANVVPANVIPPPVQRMTVLLTAQGRRYQINLSPDLRDLLLGQSWLHNSGKLIFARPETAPANRGQLHLFVADLRADGK